jgi:hypothetical protein
VRVGLSDERLSQPLESVFRRDTASLCVFEERVGVVANESTFIEATRLNVLRQYVQHARRLARNWVVLVLKLVHFEDVGAPRMVDNEVNSRAHLIALAAELNSGFAVEAHTDARQEARHSLFLLFLALLAPFGVDAGIVFQEVARVEEGRPTIGTLVWPRSEVDCGRVWVEVARSSKCTVAIRTPEWALARMRSRVPWKAATM